MAAALYEEPVASSMYVDRRQDLSAESYAEKLEQSTTLYVGNLSFYTQEEQIYELFSYCGEVKRVIMGLHRYNRTPCGFCFVEFYTHEEAQVAVQCLNRFELDDEQIRTDWDTGFEEGRQYGRGWGGGQRRHSMKEPREDSRDDEGVGMKRERAA